jgi:hypothetical protein
MLTVESGMMFPVGLRKTLYARSQGKGSLQHPQQHMYLEAIVLKIGMSMKEGAIKYLELKEMRLR